MDWQAPIRWGSKDRTSHYLAKTEYQKSYSYENVNDLKYSIVGKYYQEAYNRITNLVEEEEGCTIIPNTFGYTVSVLGSTQYIDTAKPLIAVPSTGNNEYELEGVKKRLVSKLNDKFYELSGTKKPYDTGVSGDKVPGYGAYNGVYTGANVILGTEVAIVGSGDTTNYVPEWTKSVDSRTSSSFEDIMNVYILNGGNLGYTLADVQTAVWLHNDHEGQEHGYNADGSGRQTLTNTSGGGFTLYEEAKCYYNYLKELKGANNVYENLVSMNTSNYQVFVNRVDSNRNQDEYIVGPFSVSYPQYKYSKFSRIKDINIQAGGQTLSYAAGDFKVKTTSGNSYPSKNENFWVIVNAGKIGYPEQMTVTPVFEYVSYVAATYSKLVGDGGELRIYQYKGYMEDADIGIRCNFYIYYEKEGEEDVQIKYLRYTDWFYAVQAYIKMDLDNYKEEDEQELMPAKPSYGKEQVSKSVTIDLKTKLEGYVWVDGTAGKESTYNGQSGDSQDKPMSGVRVILHQVTPSEAQANASQKGKNCVGTVKAETKTDDKGHYGFYDLNPMYTYYVEFVYNGQYYQPTIYNGANYGNSYNPVSNIDVSWNRSSKGTDIKTDRQNLNAKFKEIGSDPKSYQGGKTYTRTELREMNAIDDFGNVGENANSFVKDSMLSSYTGYNANGTFQRTYYPVYDKFVIGDSINQVNRASLTTDSLGNYLKIYNMLYNGTDKGYNNLYVNQGYVIRETVDLALHEDIFQATLEIKDKKQTYKYNKNDGLSDEGFWEIETNISDAYLSEAYRKAKAGANTNVNAYYNKEDYTREVYKEDYSFRTSAYNAETISKADIDSDDELKVYVTYKITVRNQSDAIATQVTEIVNYYDKEYTLVTSGEYAPYVGDRRGNPTGVNVTTSATSKYSGTEKSTSKYNRTYLSGFDSVTLDPDKNKDMYLYVTFQVNKADGHIILDEAENNGDINGFTPKENIVEINGYRTYYTERAVAPNAKNSRTDTEYVSGDVAGFIDIDSVAGNVIPDNISSDNGSINANTFEDDTSKGPNIRIRLNREHTRTIDGTVFDDERTVTEDLSQIGNGIRDNGETGVNGVKVELVELLNARDGSGTVEYVWASMRSGDTTTKNFIIGNSNINVNQTYNVTGDGQYKFESFAPGNYIVRFTYGDGTETILGTKATNYETGEVIDNPITQFLITQGCNKQEEAGNGYVANQNNIVGINKKSYNGQDYKSTSYQIGVGSNGAGAYQNISSGSYSYDFAGADTGLYSDAKDIYSRREAVNSYSSQLMNGNAETLASFEYLSKYYSGLSDADKLVKIQNLLNELIAKTYMTAETGVMNISFEYNRSSDGNYTNVANNIGSSNYDKTGYYNISNVDLGLVQRPQSQLKVTEQISNVKVILSNGNTLFDASQKATNVMWIAQKAHGQDVNNTYQTGNNYRRENYINDRVSTGNTLVKIPVVRAANSKGRIQLTMDEELMHGSTLQITHIITVANVGEVDFTDTKFYYTGVEDSPATNIAKTRVAALVDYVGAQLSDDHNTTRNNLQFMAEANPDWEATNAESLVNDGLLNLELKDEANNYTTIIKTKDGSGISKELVPILWDEQNPRNARPSTIRGVWDSEPQKVLDTVNNTSSVAGVKLVLIQTLSTTNNNNDDYTYNNIAEIAKTVSPVGRRLAYSVAGNQDPTTEPYEIDTDSAQEVVILPPFGQTTIHYGLGIVIGGILIAGLIVVIVVTKRKKTL